MTTLVCTRLGAALAAVFISTITACAEPAQEGKAPPPVPFVDRVIESIARCLGEGREAVLLGESMRCEEYRKGVSYLRDNNIQAPFDINVEDVCKNEGQEDWRRLPANVVKRLVAPKAAPLDPSGIRIIGGIFCQKLDLVGLDLPYSLVLDRSLFKLGIDARNFRTRGDLAVDQSFVLNEFRLTRGRVEGTVFGNGSFIERLAVLDSKIDGSLIFRESVLHRFATFDGVVLAGELSVRQSALSYFLLQFSRVGGVLDLSGSQARCAYNIKKSEIGDMVAVRSGFGSRRTINGSSRYGWGQEVLPAQDVRSRLEVAKIVGDAEECAYPKIASPVSFHLSDSHVRSSLCLRDFHWLSSVGGISPESFITLNDTKVGAAIFIDLASARTPSQPATDSSGKIPVSRRFEALGIETDALIFNFKLAAQGYQMVVNGLRFKRIYAATADLDCNYEPHYSSPLTTSGDSRASGNRDEIKPESRSGLRLPEVDEVMAWLEMNAVATTQPFAAFVDAFQKAGEDSDAKKLRIARATKELWLRFAKTFWSAKVSYNVGPTAAVAGAPAAVPTSPAPSLASDAMSFVSDLIAIVFGTLLWLVADHGYRPEKVGWFVLGTLGSAAIYFWFVLRIVGYVPAKKNVVHPIGFIFLFDRLLPAYRIREDHYNIAAFYKLAGPKIRRQRGRPRAGAPGVATLRYWRMNLPVVRANGKDVRRAEMCLDVVKIVGLVLAIFLVAAINAIFTR
jgi:hypothetical protein